MANSITLGSSFFGYPVANDISSNTYVLVQDNLSNSKGGFGNSYRLTPTVLMQKAIIEANTPLSLPVFTANSVPAANAYVYALAVILDSNSSPTLCISNGNNWINLSTSSPLV